MNRVDVLKINRINLLAILLVGLIVACGEDKRGQYATDDIPPGQVSDVEVENIPGGAIISYTVPDDDDLLYVKVVYQMSDGTQVEQKSSAYTPKITVEGLGRARKQTVQLICGDRSGNESTPYQADIEPLDAPIYEILESVDITGDFGGIRINWSNPLKENIVLTLYLLDEYNNFIEMQNVYSSSTTAKYNIRGLPPEERTFAVTIRDRWKNKTDMVSGAYLPLFEEKLDRLKFARWNPPGIPYYQLDNNWTIEKLWNGLVTDPGFSFPLTVSLPLSITFDIGQTAMLSRIKVNQRTSASQLFAGYNVKRFQLWGSPSPNVNQDFDTWVFLGEFTSVKPSGLPVGQLTEEDIAYGTAGEEYMIEENANVPVQYIRLHIMETHGGGTTVAQMNEIEFYGQIVK